MAGDETSRFCSACQREVHNLAALSAAERQTLLRSGAGSLCGRYRVALRRPAPGRENAYWRHLARYGAGVAAAGAATFVFWQSRAHGVGPVDYLVGQFSEARAMPGEYYEEHEVIMLGAIVSEEELQADLAAMTARREAKRAATGVTAPFKLTRAQVQALLPQLATTVPLPLTAPAAPVAPTADPAER